MPVIVSPWQVVKRQLETEGAYNRLYDPDLKGKVSEVDLSAVKVARLEEHSVTTDANGNGTIVLSAEPDTNEPIVALGKGRHVNVTSVTGSTLTVQVFKHDHVHKWLEGGTLVGATSTGGYLYYTLTHGGGDVVRHTDGNPAHFLFWSGDSTASISSAFTDTKGLTLLTNSTASVFVFYVPKT